jgi:hypothetical protein
MSRSYPILFGAVAALLGACSGVDVPGDAAIGDASSNTFADASADASSVGCAPGLAADLCMLREEEKLARDVYTALFASTSISVFENIARSEQMHTDAVAAQLAMRGIPDPVTDDTPGVFQAPAFQALYASLTLEGRMSDVAALRVGATIEDLDLRDIQQMQARTSDAAALALFDNLACGSRNHMRSFAGQLESRGERYVAAYLTPAELADILASPREMCGG